MNPEVGMVFVMQKTDADGNVFGAPEPCKVVAVSSVDPTAALLTVGNSVDLVLATFVLDEVTGGKVMSVITSNGEDRLYYGFANCPVLDESFEGYLWRILD